MAHARGCQKYSTDQYPSRETYLCRSAQSWIRSEASLLRCMRGKIPPRMIVLSAKVAGTAVSDSFAVEELDGED